MASQSDGSVESKSLSTILQGKQGDNRLLQQRIMWSTETNLYMDVAILCMSLLHAWTMDDDLDRVCQKKLKMSKPAVPLSFGLVSRQG